MGNMKNASIALLAPLPSIAFFLAFLHRYPATVPVADPADPTVSTGGGAAAAATSGAAHLWEWCARHPLLLANLLFFANVDVLFWVVGLLQSNNWMIDLYWTVIPVMLVHYYASHPLATADALRSMVVMVLTWVWSLRLTHNYFRREGWQWGAREDWRFHDMRRQYGKNWWWVSFLAVYLSQQVFLIGICLPMYAVHSTDKAWDVWDSLATVVCISGIVIAYFADTQLYNYVNENKTLKELGMPAMPNLDRGLWWYSRHPNYFGEQLWWWGLFIFGWSVGQGWTFVGTLVNSLCLLYVTVLVEERMLKREHRAEAYRLYQATTSMWIPWFKKTMKETKTKRS
uniref:Uncharacterized protein C594.04c n=1 Tax=Anthurium amnicola TaxID=1678845 RepID=A0A1D1XLY9_9ARAE